MLERIMEHFVANIVPAIKDIEKKQQGRLILMIWILHKLM